MKGDISELNHQKELLTSFVESTGLKVNFDKILDDTHQCDRW